MIDIYIIAYHFKILRTDLSKGTMNCLTPRSRRRKYTEEANAPPYYPQPPYNPDFVMEDRAVLVLPCGVRYSVRYSVTCYKDEDIGGERGRRSLYEGVNWMPVSAQVYLLVCIATHALAALAQ